MEEHPLLGFVLLADEFERVIQRLDRGFERSFDVAASQAKFGDVAFDFLEPGTCLLSRRSARPCASRTIILPSFSAAVSHFIGESLRGQQRIAQVGFALAMLGEQRFHTQQVLAEPVDFAQRVLVVVGRLGQKRDHFGTVEPAQGGPEPLLTEIERRDAHHALGRQRSGLRGGGGRWRRVTVPVDDRTWCSPEMAEAAPGAPYAVADTFACRIWRCRRAPS